MNYANEKKTMIDVSRRLYEKGWVANHDGNVTIKLSDEWFLATPTAMSKGDLTEGDLIIVNERGEVVEGSRKGFSELSIHLFIYQNRSNVRAVLHSHAPHAMALSILQRELDLTSFPEAVVSLGARIPLSHYTEPSKITMGNGHAFLQVGNGVFTMGTTLWEAYFRMELIEHLAHVSLLALPHAVPWHLPDSQKESLLSKRRSIGLEPQPQPSPNNTPTDLHAVITEAIVKVLSK